jgi:hypothetical protein
VIRSKKQSIVDNFVVSGVKPVLLSRLQGMMRKKQVHSSAAWNFSLHIFHIDFRVIIEISIPCLSKVHTTT